MTHKYRDLTTSASEHPGLLLFSLVARRLRRRRTGNKRSWGTAPNPRSRAAALDNPADGKMPNLCVIVRARLRLYVGGTVKTRPDRPSDPPGANPLGREGMVKLRLDRAANVEMELCLHLVPERSRHVCWMCVDGGRARALTPFTNRLAVDPERRECMSIWPHYTPFGMKFKGQCPVSLFFVFLLIGIMMESVCSVRTIGKVYERSLNWRRA
jgi:hypothetical protein